MIPISEIRNKWFRRALVIAAAPVAYAVFGIFRAFFLLLLLTLHLIRAFPAALVGMTEITRSRPPLWKTIRNAWRGGDA